MLESFLRRSLQGELGTEFVARVLLAVVLDLT